MNTYVSELPTTIIDEFKKAFEHCPTQPEFYQPSKGTSYNELRLVFNRRFDFMPSLIFQPLTTEHVAIATKFATDKDVEVTVKSGGHDHEGESVATGKVLIDFAKMNITNTDLPDFPSDQKPIRQIRIQPGAKFINIKAELDKAHLGIPHGTCQSVAIAGYTMGGGWGPWTRKYGMGCEHLKGATIVLGNGTVKYLGTSAFYNKEVANDENTEGADSKLLWAIRGGGGLSYGIVTEFFFEPFELPKIAHSFHISSDMLPVFKKIKATAVIEAWEKVTAPGEYPQLIGTNLKVVAKAVNTEDEVSEDAILEWRLNGHFGGNRAELLELVIKWGKYLVELQLSDLDFAANEQTNLFDLVIDGIKEKFEERLGANNEDLDQAIDTSHISSFFKGEANGYPYTFESWDRFSAAAKNNGLSLETDCPAPHKITSRMPTEKWDDISRAQLVCSLQSPLLKGVKEFSNISCYITLGAIHGDFYATEEARKESALRCAFPYQARPFTIQYQTWWDMPTRKEDGKCIIEDAEEVLIETRRYVNRAMDWMQECRDYQMNETYGSFISFKDASIPTENYFVQNYETLKNIKLDYSKDKKYLFRSRKTII